MSFSSLFYIICFLSLILMDYQGWKSIDLSVDPCLHFQSTCHIEVENWKVLLDIQITWKAFHHRLFTLGYNITLFLISSETGKWSGVEVSGEAPSPRTCRGSAWCNGQLYVFSGGEQGTDPVADSKLHVFHSGKYKIKLIFFAV